MTDNFSDECSSNTDVEIESILQKFSSSESCSESPGFAKCIAFCCNSFLHHRPVLLTTVYKEFCTHTTSSESKCSSQRWLLQKIVSTFGNLISVITDNNRKLGTMLKRSDNKDNRVIQQLIYDECLQSDHVDLNVISNESDTEPLNSMTVFVKVLRHKILEQKSKMISMNTIDLQTFDPYEFIKEVFDPYLWNFFISLMGEKGTDTFEKVDLRDCNSKKIMPCFHIISCLIFSADHTCQLPLHVLLADLLDKYTYSSSDCLQIFNQFGICCSKDSLKRYQTSVIENNKSLEFKFHPIPSLFVLLAT